MERFWAKVERSEDGCWLWTASTDAFGYGLFRISNARGIQRAHIFIHELIGSPVPHGLIVCHRCDNPACVRPDHHFFGSHADNAADRNRKGRHWTHVGENHGMAKLTDEQALEIMRRKKAGESATVLAAEFGICRTHVYDVIKRCAR